MAQRGEGYLYFKHTQGHAPHHTLLMEMLLAKQNDGVSLYFIFFLNGGQRSEKLFHSCWLFNFKNKYIMIFFLACSREPANTKNSSPKNFWLIATCKFLSQCEWWLWLHRCWRDWWKLIKMRGHTYSWCQRRIFGIDDGCHFECWLHYLFLDTCEEEEENPLWGCLTDYWLAQSSP